MLHSPLFIQTLGHLSRMLGIANKFIPIYKDVKPLVSHIPEILNRLSNINQVVRERGNDFIAHTKLIKEEVNNSLTFFK